jgi:hypothetical protein
VGSSKKKKNEAFSVAPAFADLEGVSKILHCVNCEGSDSNCIVCDGTGWVSLELAQEMAADNDCQIQDEWNQKLLEYSNIVSKTYVTMDDFEIIGVIKELDDGEGFAWTLKQKNPHGEEQFAGGVSTSASFAQSLMQNAVDAKNCPQCGQFMSFNGSHVCPASTETANKVKIRISTIQDLTAAFMQKSQGGQVPTEDVLQYYAEVSGETVLALNDMNAENSELTPEEWQELRKQLAASNASALSMLDTTQLSGVAQSQGIESAVLLSPESIAFYLNQAYYAHSDEDPPTWSPDVKQLKVATAGNVRLNTAKITGEYDGLTITEIQQEISLLNAAGYMPAEALEVQPAPLLPANTWVATKEEVSALFLEARKTLGAEDYSSHYNLAYSATLEQKTATVELYKKIATAHPDLTLSEDEITNFTTAREQALYKLEYIIAGGSDEEQVLKYVGDSLGLSPEVQTFFSSNLLLRSNRYDTNSPIGSLEKYRAWAKLTEEKQAAVAPYLTKAEYEWNGATLNLSSINSDDPEYAAKVAKVFKDINDGQQLVQNYNAGKLFDGVERPDRQSAAYKKLNASTERMGDNTNGTARAWAQEQKMDTLRAVATEMGLLNADKASRGQLAGFISAHTKAKGKSVTEWADSISNSASNKITVSESKLAQQAAMKQIKAKIKSGEMTATEAAIAQGFAAPPGSSLSNDLLITASKAKIKAGKPNMDPPAPGSFSQTVALTQGFAKHTKASLTAIPETVPVASLEAATFSDAPNPGLGGMHAKSFYKDSEGATWMMKPYSNAKGGSESRAAAESVASAAMRAGGIPTVPVYHATINGQKGAFQPLIANQGTIDSKPSNYSQADVDSIVRMHVGTWLVGDHDLHAGNVIRTEGGGLVPIDQGQAFKNFGRDKLAIDYHPNKAYGETPPIWQAVYTSAQTGALAENVRVRPEVALGAISRYESIPDDEWRTMMSPVAQSGASSSSTYWREPIAKAAAKKLNKTQASVSNEEIASEFLDQAVERKRNLRGDFLKFFVSEGWSQAKTTFTAG